MSRHTGNPFDVKFMRCSYCGAVRKQYANFESQWTALVVEGGKPIYVCPSCLGIPDPAPRFCRAYGHDYKHGICQRCGVIELK